MSPRGRIGRIGGVRRRPDHWSSPHERAKVRAAERLEAPLNSVEEAWLEAHLADCEPCETIAAAYALDRLSLRQLGADHPEPPRDLWARTAAGMERESGARQPARTPARSRRATSWPVLGAFSGLAVTLVVVMATAFSGGFLGWGGPDGHGPTGSLALASQEVRPQPTAIAVGAGEVHWLGTAGDGGFAYSVANVDVVCPLDRQPDCVPLEDGHAKRVSLDATPRFVFHSPVSDQAVIVGTDVSGADAVLVVALPTPDPTPEATAVAGPEVSAEPAGSPASAPSVPPASESPIDLPTVTPSDATPTSLASSMPTASDLASPDPSSQPAIVIITNVTVVGRTAAYSANGTWFAFSARPADGSAGPDIYVWHVGDLEARPLTSDHASIFASWVGGSLLGSRLTLDPLGEPDGSLPPGPTLEIPPPIDGAPASDAGPSSEPAVPEPAVVVEGLPQTFLIDPSFGTETPLLDADWQPSVDPTGLAVVAWQGTVGIGSDGLNMAPANGNLVIHPFRGPLASDEPPASPSVTPEPSPTLPSESPVVGSPSPPANVALDFPAQIVAAGPIADFDARWDDTGSWLAIWIADPIDSGLGRLSLLHFDPLTGLVDRPVGAPQDVTALPGFSIGSGRLAWASPPGQGGEGSRIQIAAWTATEVGAVESIPVEGAIVVQ